MLNTRHISELMEAGKIGQIKDAMEKSMAPGSQTFEQALMRLIEEGIITQEEALSQADSPSNLYWLISNASNNGAASKKTNTIPSPPEKGEGPSYTEFSLDL